MGSRVEEQRVRAAATGRRRKPELATTKVVILAGGRGARLAPYTSVLPKPLMPIGDRSILEIVVDQLAEQGLRDLTFCVGYLSHLIRAVFDNHVESTTSITYAHEDKPLGTAGPLRLVEDLSNTFIVMNGDVLSTVDYRKLLRSHAAHENVLTIATRKRTITVDYGVLHLDGAESPVMHRVEGYDEKPEIVSPVSMGIYVLEKRALDFIPEDAYFDFPDLVQALLAAGEKIGAYVHDGLWFDIGRKDDYELAAAAWDENGAGRAAKPRRARARGTA
jgi:NDP-sugar pyrophosphorylase family protein